MTQRFGCICYGTVSITYSLLTRYFQLLVQFGMSRVQDTDAVRMVASLYVIGSRNHAVF